MPSYVSQRCGVTRYFFDFTTPGQSLYAYKGDEFLNCQHACQYAEAIALDLKHSLHGECAGWSLEVAMPQTENLIITRSGGGADCSLTELTRVRWMNHTELRTTLSRFGYRGQENAWNTSQPPGHFRGPRLGAIVYPFQSSSRGMF